MFVFRVAFFIWWGLLDSPRPYALFLSPALFFIFATLCIEVSEYQQYQDATAEEEGEFDEEEGEYDMEPN